MCGVASRRKAEELVKSGRITVNGKKVESYVQVSDKDTVKLDGKKIFPRKKVYYMFNKPVGYITTKSDPQGRKTVFDILKVEKDVFPVGRLDKDTSGLLLLTNDGEISQILLHPRYEIERVYVGVVAGVLLNSTIEKMREGIKLPYGYVSKMDVKTLKKADNISTVKITIRQGRKREIRRAFKFVGHEVLSLKRISFGPISLDENLKIGAWRKLNFKEINALENMKKKMRPANGSHLEKC
jgi:23S rRNA pseudouridine2605 synthase